MNKYLEKIALQLTDKAVHITSSAIGAGTVGILSALQKERDKYDKGVLKKEKLTNWQRAGNATTGAITGAFLGYSLGKTIRPGFREYNWQESGSRVSHHDLLAKVNAKAFNIKTKDQANKAFRSHLHKYHPDKNNGSKVSEEKFKEISIAKDALQKTEWFKKLASMKNLKSLAYMRKGRKSYSDLAIKFNVGQNKKFKKK